MKYTLNLRVLHLDGSVSTCVVDEDRGASVVDAVMWAGSKLRQADPTVCQVRCDLLEKSFPPGDPVFAEKVIGSWVGHATKEHRKAIGAAERSKKVW